jgi:peptidoglycan/xylan/chitin deacetylase (PgdA/CDA1 family)
VIARLRGLAGRLRPRGPGGLILLYHRVAELPTDPQLLAVTPAHFDQHLAVLARVARPIALGALAQAARNAGVAPRSVALTFDDGYADNLYQAAPLLERHGVPATVYVATGFTGADREFWWDDLDRLLLQPGRLPERLGLRLADRELEVDLGGDACWDSADAERHRGWSVADQSDPGPRQALYRSLCGALRAMPDAARGRVLRELAGLAGQGEAGRPSHRAMDEAEVRQLADSELVEVGAHTVNHPLLASLSPAEQRDEIGRSRERLTGLLGRAPASFSYPFGGRRDYDAASVAIARELGFEHACANFEGLVRSGADPFQLPRVVVRDWDGAELERRLESWLGA